jgi:stress-induced morphogen
MIPPHELEALLRAGFPDAELRVKDMTGTQDHYEAAIASDAFVGKGLVEQHRMVYAALGDAMKAQIHALTFKTYTKEAWSKVLVK